MVLGAILGFSFLSPSIIWWAERMTATFKLVCTTEAGSRKL